MIKTQVQLPDELYRAAKELAARKEWSLAEIVRKGVEYVLRTCPPPDLSKDEWTLPGPFDLGMDKDFFKAPDWRVNTNLSSGAALLVKEKTANPYGKRRK